MGERYAPGRTHMHDKSVCAPDLILAQLKRRKVGASILWSAGHSKGAARVKAFRGNAGNHPAWRGVDVTNLEFEIYPADDGTWSVSVRRVK